MDQTCNHCGYENLAGALLCKNCGRQLGKDTGRIGPTTHKLATSTLPVRPDAGDSQQASERNTFGIDSTLRIVVHGPNVEIVKQFRAGAMMIGRVDNTRKIKPEIDLMNYGAHENGVSRVHALLRREGNRLYLRDLGSANGTYINGEKLVAHVPCRLSHGDTVRLGTLVLQVFFA